MSIVCPICHWWACTCNGSRCNCWLSEPEIRANLSAELQQANITKQQAIVQQTKLAIQAIEDNTLCSYDKHWARGKCIYCGNYKRYEKYYEDWQCPIRVSLKQMKNV